MSDIKDKIVESAVAFRDATFKMSGHSEMIKEAQKRNFKLDGKEPTPEFLAFLKKHEGAIEAEREMVESTSKLIQVVDEYNAMNGIVRDDNK
jgi:hypothetical protein